MVLVIDPEEGDRERLLSGPQGRLLARILAAMRLADEAVYVASALPRHTPMADTAALAAGGMDSVTLHHIALVQPKRLVAFGANILPLLGHELTKDIVHLREINQNWGSIPLLANEGLDSLMSMPRLKARFWRRWIEWSAL
jgi:DNA polymerase